MSEEERKLWDVIIEETIDSYRDFLVCIGSEKRDQFLHIFLLSALEHFGLTYALVE